MPDPFSTRPGARLYRTGDRVRALEDGTIEYLERMDQQVKLRGHRIELGEIEARLLAHPDVNEAVVVVRRDLATARLVGYVGCADEAARGELPSQLLTQLRAALPAYMVPAQLVVLARLPQTPNGKIDRPALPAPELPRREHGPHGTSSSASCSALRAGAARRRARLEDDFFERGGDSLSSLQLAVAPGAAGHTLALKDVFNVAHGSRRLHRALVAQGLNERREQCQQSRVCHALAHTRCLRAGAALVLTQLEPESPPTTSAAAAPAGRLELSFIERALSQLVARALALRTGFEARMARSPACPRCGRRARTAARARGADAEVRARALFTEDSARPFDLARAALSGSAWSSSRTTTTCSPSACIT